MDVRISKVGIGVAWIALCTACSLDATQVEPPGTGDSSAGDASTGADADGGSGSPTCTDPDSQVLWANQGIVQPPMELSEAEMLGFEVARSWAEDDGTLEVTMTTHCGGPLYLWALVWDVQGGNQPENADSLYVAIDEGEEDTWLYGCDTVEGTDDRWWWLPMGAWTMSNCDHQPLQPDLPAGEHTIVVRNREEGSHTNVAAIAAIVVSHDPDIDLAQYYELPY